MRILLQKKSQHYPALIYYEAMLPDAVLHAFTCVSHFHDIIHES